MVDVRCILCGATEESETRRDTDYSSRNGQHYVGPSLQNVFEDGRVATVCPACQPKADADPELIVTACRLMSDRLREVARG